MPNKDKMIYLFSSLIYIFIIILIRWFYSFSIDDRWEEETVCQRFSSRKTYSVVNEDIFHERRIEKQQMPFDN